MAEPKTKPTDESPDAFLKTIEPAEKRNDALELLRMFEKATGQKGVMWGTAIVGFGSYDIKKGARTDTWPLVGFSPRRQNLTLYVISDREEPGIPQSLGKHKVSGSCLHIHRLADVDRDALSALIADAYRRAKMVHGC